MDSIISIPIFLITVMLQVAIISRFPLIHGAADLSMLVMIAWGIHSHSRFAWIWAVVGGLVISLYSKISWLAIIPPYLIVIVVTQLLHGRFWNSPILAMLLMTIIGSFMCGIIAIIALLFMDIPIDFKLALNEIIIPSVFLNLILALPVFFLVKDLSRWIYPQVENA